MSVFLSVLLHGGIVALAVFGWWRFEHRPPPDVTPVIDATVVSGTPATAAPPPAPPAPTEQAQPETPPPGQAAPVSEQAVEPPPPQPAPPPPGEAEQPRKQEAEQQARKEAEQKREAEEQQAVDAKRQAEAQQKAEARRQADARRMAEEKRQAEVKRLADEKRQADEKRKADQQRQAEEQKKLQQAKDDAALQSDLQRSLAAEEQATAARNGPAMASWQQQIVSRIRRAWLQPPSARPGIHCTVDVSQAPGGTVVGVKVGACNGDAAVRESIEAAVYRASPLPPPPDPALFERELVIEFAPSE